MAIQDVHTTLRGRLVTSSCCGEGERGGGARGEGGEAERPHSDSGVAPRDDGSEDNERECW